MSEWVQFHRSLCKGGKRGIPRALRFVLMELSLEARAGHGVIDLPEGMGDEDAVCDLLGGDPAEVRAAVRKFASGDDPSIVFAGPEGGRVLILPRWSDYNSTKEKSAKVTARVRRLRARKHELLATASRDRSEGPEGGSPLLSSPLISSPLSEKDPERDNGTGDRATEPPPSGTRRKRQRRAAPTYGPKSETSAQVTWRIWRTTYAASARRYGNYVDGLGDGDRIARIATHAEQLLPDFDAGGEPGERLERMLRHWFREYLRDDGTRNFLAEQRHPLQFFERGIPTYGLPKIRAAPVATGPALAPKPAGPPPVPPTPETLAALRSIGAMPPMARGSPPATLQAQAAALREATS